MRRALRHAPAATPRAEPAALARERHEAVQPAGGAPKAGEAPGQTSAPQKVTKLSLDKSRDPLAARSGAARARRVSKCSCTIPYKMSDVVSLASYYVALCDISMTTAPHVP